MTMNILAVDRQVDKIALDRLRGECVEEVKRLNGSLTFDDAVAWQKGEL